MQDQILVVNQPEEMHPPTKKFQSVSQSALMIESISETFHHLLTHPLAHSKVRIAFGEVYCFSIKVSIKPNSGRFGRLLACGREGGAEAGAEGGTPSPGLDSLGSSFFSSSFVALIFAFTPALFGCFFTSTFVSSFVQVLQRLI